MRSSLPVMVAKRACQSAVNFSNGVQFRILKISEGEGAKIPRLKLVSFSARSRNFVQSADKVFGSQVCVTLEHLHRLMSANR